MADHISLTSENGMTTYLFSSPTSTGAISSLSPATVWTSYGTITRPQVSLSTVVVVPIVTVAIIAIVVFFFIRVYRRKPGNASNNEFSHPTDLESVAHFRNVSPEPITAITEPKLSAPKLVYGDLQTDCKGSPKSSYDLNREGGNMKRCLQAPRNLTVSQYMDPSLLSSSPFQRFDENRRSNSVGSLNPLTHKSHTLSSRDSGFVSERSIPQSPGSPMSPVYFTDASCGNTASKAAVLKNLIQDAVANFHRIPDKVLGSCYSSRVFAIGEFDSSGGCLHLQDCEDVQLRIPPGALASREIVYFMMQFENNEQDDHTVNYSPTFECGPDGLEFQVPVELSFPHSAVDTEVAALSRAENSKWSESSEDGPEISVATPDMVTLKIHHFTGYKLSAYLDASRNNLNRSCRSRIPVRQQSTVPVRRRSSAHPGKKLLMAVFKSEDKARVYFINYAGSASEDKIIDKREESLHFATDSPWKEFTFYPGRGGLVLEARYVDRNPPKIYNKFIFDDQKVLRTSSEYVELVSADRPLILDLIFYQPGDRHNCTQFGVKLEKLSSPPPTYFPLTEEYRLRHLVPLMSSLQLHTPASFGNHTERQNSSLLAPPGRAYERSVSDVFKFPARQPQEHCEHEEACNCCQNASRIPVEVDSDGFAKQADSLRRGGANRRSKESGYESTIHSPVSPLKGPETLENSGRVSSELNTSSGLTLSNSDLQMAS